MNFSINRFIFFLAACHFLASCSKLVDVQNVEPINQLEENQAITTVGQAQSVLYGTYGVIKTGLEVVAYAPGLTSLRGLTMVPGPFGTAAEAAYMNNEVAAEDYYVDAVYTKFYKVINNANHIIEKTPLIETQDSRKEEIVGEAKFIRALSNFYLLRMYGYFFDAQSKYGIVLKTQPIKSAATEPRANVQACYDLINADLDYAIEHAPSFKSTFYASKEAAKALKAKVLLYQKKYDDASVLAKEVIGSGKFQLEENYSNIFFKKIVNTLEVIFQTPYDEKNDRNNKAFMFRSSYIPSPYYKGILAGDNRDTAVLTTTAAGVLRNKKFNNTVFNGQTLTADTEYFLRLDEIYLILAEALARGSAPLQDAVDTLNVIRKRVDMPEVALGTKAEVLEAIRVEKILELGAESGEEWYDLVRYAVEGDLNITDFKPGVVSESRYVLPLPFPTVNLSNNVVEQNPNY